jgi:glycerophosphoryl diester phosphodiesterase
LRLPARTSGRADGARGDDFFGEVVCAAMSTPFDLQGHRGARGLRPENTLPSFEAAFDAGVSSVEPDVHLTRDGVAVLCHDPVLGGPLCTLARSGPPLPTARPAVRGLSLAELRCYRADGNPDPARWRRQDAGVTPLARLFAEERGLEPYAIPTVADLFSFAAAYAGEMGLRAGKTAEQRARAAGVRFDLELKRMPFYPEAAGAGPGGELPGLLERRVVEEARAAGVVGRTTVRSFDHRSVRAVRELEPGLTGAVLVAGTAPVDPAGLAREAGAQLYCPDYLFVDAEVVRRAHAGGLRVLAWTVNEPEQWERLVDWGVDGLTTDYPDRLARWLRRRGVAF